MMRLPIFMIVCTALWACTPETGPPETDETGDTNLEPAGYPSTFEEGRFRITALSLNPLGEGTDHNGDGIPDNNLPNALMLVDLAIADQDFSLIGFNDLIATSLADNVLNILIGAEHIDRSLRLTVYSGLFQEETGDYAVDPGSFDESGEPISIFEGHFDSETAFGVSADSAVLPVTFILEDGPLPVPLQQASLGGDLTPTSLSGQISGVIPGDELVNNVIAPMIPEDGTSGMSREEIIELVQGLTTNETLMDVPLSNGKRGISAAFSFETIAQEFSLTAAD
jgi:hypothetical protein